MKFSVLIVFLLAGWSISLKAIPKTSHSVYSLKPADPEAVYFTPEPFGIKADGKTDVTEALQKAINQVKNRQNFGVLFIPEGKYRISKTIYVPGAVRLIGYGKSRPAYVSREDNKTTCRFEVGQDGKLIHMQKAFPRGEYGSVVDSDGTLYMAEGQIFVFDKNGKEIKRINLDERPISMAIGGKEKNLLFVTTSTSVYKVKIK